jgi:predicted DNA-binding transcriptional regulator AlpA
MRGRASTRPPRPMRPSVNDPRGCNLLSKGGNAPGDSDAGFRVASSFSPRLTRAGGESAEGNNGFSIDSGAEMNGKDQMSALPGSPAISSCGIIERGGLVGDRKHEEHNGADSLLVDVPGVAKLLICSTDHVRRLARTERMPPPLRIGSLLRWKRSIILEWIDAGCQPPLAAVKPRRKNASCEQR